jgi:hypothetical protein
MLAQCVDSVNAQTVPVDSHMIMSHAPVKGMASQVHCAHMQNWLLRSVVTPWVMRLADDDKLLAHHWAIYADLLRMPGILPDVIYSWDATHNLPRVNCNGWSQEQLIDHLFRENFIDGSAVAIRTELLFRAGGWPSLWEDKPPWGGHFVGHDGRPLAAYEDWALWQVLARAGAKFVCVPEETWLYGAGDWPRISNGH